MISLSRVSKTYGNGRVKAVRDLSLTVAKGKLAVLLGESGCGKTTTLKMINRLIEPSAGDIEIDGENVRLADPIDLRRRIGYVFQGIGLFPHMTVAQNVGCVPRLLRWPRRDILARTSELLAMVGLPAAEYAGRYPGELSGGQRQRVGVARALAAKPSVLLMDEPFGALDPVTRCQMQDELKTLQRKLELTIVLVTHDMTEALLLADRIAVMRSGRIVASGTPEQLMADPGHPYARTLMAMPKRQADRVEQIARGQT